MGSVGLFDFCGEQHEVYLIIHSSSFRLRVRNSQQSWANTFEANYIEQLTQKTGSYKGFALFSTLLANTISNPGMNGMNLELLTPLDLETLRGNRDLKASRPPDDRRYLLFVNSDGFSRTNYPLNLLLEANVLKSIHEPNTHVHRSETKINNFPDKYSIKPEVTPDIHNIIHKLQEEVRRLQIPTETAWKEKYEEMVKINETLKNELVEATKSVEASKNLKINKQMKKMVENMEKTLSEEKARFKKVSQEQRKKIKRLENELEGVKTDKNSLEIKMRALKTELAIYKRGSNFRGRSPYSRSRYNSRETSRESSYRATKPQPKRGQTNLLCSSQERLKRPPVYSRGAPSRERFNHIRSRDPSPSGSVGSVASSVRSRTSINSNSSTRSRKRFDPTAYIAAKKAKESDIKRRKNGSTNSRLSRRSASNSSSLTRKGIYLSDGVRKGRSSTPDPDSIISSDDEAYRSRKKQGIEDSLVERSFDIDEIDSRLSALQQYMNDLATT